MKKSQLNKKINEELLDEDLQSILNVAIPVATIAAGLKYTFLGDLIGYALEEPIDKLKSSVNKLLGRAGIKAWIKSNENKTIQTKLQANIKRFTDVYKKMDPTKRNMDKLLAKISSVHNTAGREIAKVAKEKYSLSDEDLQALGEINQEAWKQFVEAWKEDVSNIKENTMKRSKLQRIINEEIRRVLKEGNESKITFSGEKTFMDKNAVIVAWYSIDPDDQANILLKYVKNPDEADRMAGMEWDSLKDYVTGNAIFSDDIIKAAAITRTYDPNEGIVELTVMVDDATAEIIGSELEALDKRQGNYGGYTEADDELSEDTMKSQLTNVKENTMKKTYKQEPLNESIQDIITGAAAILPAALFMWGVYKNRGLFNQGPNDDATISAKERAEAEKDVKQAAEAAKTLKDNPSIAAFLETKEAKEIYNYVKNEVNARIKHYQDTNALTSRNKMDSDEKEKFAKDFTELLRDWNDKLAAAAKKNPNFKDEDIKTLQTANKVMMQEMLDLLWKTIFVKAHLPSADENTMKKSQLSKIINEEIRNVLKEKKKVTAPVYKANHIKNNLVAAISFVGDKPLTSMRDLNNKAYWEKVIKIIENEKEPNKSCELISYVVTDTVCEFEFAPLGYGERVYLQDLLEAQRMRVENELKPIVNKRMRCEVYIVGN